MTDAFELIPVVDLMGGKAVRALGGDRANYQPLISPLSLDASPLGTVGGLLGLAPFARVYLADLDGIEGRAVQHEMIACIEAAFPDVELWVDAGLADETACREWRARHHARIVLGSESLHEVGLAVRGCPPSCALPTTKNLPPLEASISRRALSCVLSLDFHGAEFLGDPRLLDSSQFWPRDVIVMTLDRVGEAHGPNADLLAQLIERGGADRRLYAAGGVRGHADIATLSTVGASGALVATALHNGALPQ